MDILVATPGRLLDFINQGIISLRNLEIFVLDEADRMLDMGFFEDIEKIISTLPSSHQTLLFSATFPPQIQKLCEHIQKDAHFISVDEEKEKVFDMFYTTQKHASADDRRGLGLGLALCRLIVQEHHGTIRVYDNNPHGAVFEITMPAVNENIKQV